MSPIKRIIFILNALDMTGPAFAALNIIPELLTTGCSVMVIAKNGGEREQMFMSMGCDVRIFPHLGLPILGRKIIESAKKFEPAVIHTHCPDCAQAALKIANSINVPLFITANRLDNLEPLQRIITENQVHLISLSEAIREKLINKLGLPREKIRVIPNGLNLKMFPQINPEKVEERIRINQLPVVGTYGTLIEQKGQQDFIEAAQKVLNTGLDAEFLIMGHGPDKQKLRDQAEALGINNRLTFSSSTITDSQNISNINVFVEPTRKEGFGMSTLQAMAMEIPVVACGVGGIFSLIEDEVTGLLIPAGDCEAMAKSICRMLKDEKLRKELSHNARVRVEEEFSAKIVCQKLLDYYASAYATA